MYYEEPFTPQETQILSRYFSNTDRPVFALINLPEVVKGALFARYSRTHKSVRRLFLDEFVNQPDLGIAGISGALGSDTAYGSRQRAEQLYQKVFLEYGDDSVAQLGGVHLACEQASNVLTKVLEWGRLAAYLEQSTRYIPYDQRLGSSYRYFVPDEIEASGHRPQFVGLMERLFETYSASVNTLTGYYKNRYPQSPDDSQSVYRATIRAKAYDTARALLPAATLSNVGIFGTGQAYEMALIRMQGNPLSEVRSYAEMMIEELRKVVPAFMERVDRPDRGLRWSQYLAETAAATRERAEQLLVGLPQSQPEVTLVDWDPDAELKLAAASLYAESDYGDVELLELVRDLPESARRDLVRTYIGNRSNRRHKPGRAMERSTYRFDVLSDYGAFRDLQRHRMLTIEWQRLSTKHGFEIPDDIADAGLESEFTSSMEVAADVFETIRSDLGRDVAQYTVPFGYRIRYVMQMNTREAFHLLELRTQPSGHANYRRVCQEMHRLIKDVAGHGEIARAMTFVDYSNPQLERLDEERRLEQKRQSGSTR